MPDDLLVRDGEELSIRSATLVPSTLDEATRSVDAVLATEDPVVSMNLRTREPILEVLRMDGVEFPDQIPLLDTHQRHTVRAQLGSIRNLRVENDQLVGRLFVSESEPKVWSMVREGHIKDLSIGHSSIETTVVRAGNDGQVKGRSYKAPANSNLTINTRWRGKEASVTAIGADQRAKVRTTFLETPMPETIAPVAEAPAAEIVRTEATPIVNADSIRSEAIATERDRVRRLTELAGDDVPAEIRTRAINEGWDEPRAAREFLGAVRVGRRAPVADAGSVAIHSRSTDVDVNVRSLAAGLVIGQGLDPLKVRMHDGRRHGEAFNAQDAERGDRISRLSAVDICRECVRIDSGRHILDYEDAVRAAVSGASFSHVFTTNVYARLMQGWDQVGDTTTGWCDEEDVANFMTQDDISLEASANLDKLPRGATANHATASDKKESYSIARYAKQFVVDEQDMIDDRLGAIMRMPMEMGEGARRLRPDMVYSIMLQNPTMTDTGAVFNATAVTTAGGHANQVTGALSSTNLKTAITAMVKQRINQTATNPGQQLQIRPKFIIVPADLEWTARELTAAAALAKLFADSSDPFYAQLNLLASEGLRVVPDDRIGSIGVLDPRTKTVRTGTATNYFLTSGGNRGLRVAYRRGTGRAPQVRNFVLSQGQWGMGWDINMDIGVAFTEWRTWLKSTGV